MFHVSRAPGLVELLRAVTSSDEPAELDMPQPLEHAYSMFPAVSREDVSGTGTETAEVGSAGNETARKHAAPTAPRRSPHFRNIRESSCHGLSLLPCGAVDGAVAETLKAGSFRALLNEIADDFDVVILDTPPALVSADAVILASVVDDVLLVVQAGRTDRSAAERTQQQLIQAGGNLVGAVLNDPEGKVGGSALRYYPYGYPVTTD
jgi:Mrp family chromosome partitioning ATPase